jgi:hypothetical protein
LPRTRVYPEAEAPLKGEAKRRRLAEEQSEGGMLSPSEVITTKVPLSV